MVIIKRKKQIPRDRIQDVQSNRMGVYSPYYAVDGVQSSSQPIKVDSLPPKVRSNFTDKDFFSKLFTKSNYSVNGALVGGAIGLGVALYKRNHYVVYSFVGGVIGIIATNLLMKNYTFEKKVKQINK